MPLSLAYPMGAQSRKAVIVDEGVPPKEDVAILLTHTDRHDDRVDRRVTEVRPRD